MLVVLMMMIMMMACPFRCVSETTSSLAARTYPVHLSVRVCRDGDEMKTLVSTQRRTQYRLHCVRCVAVAVIASLTPS